MLQVMLTFWANCSWVRWSRYRSSRMSAGMSSCCMTAPRNLVSGDGHTRAVDVGQYSSLHSRSLSTYRLNPAEDSKPIYNYALNESPGKQPGLCPVKNPYGQKGNNAEHSLWHSLTRRGSGHVESVPMLPVTHNRRTAQGGANTELLVGALVVVIFFIAASPFYRAAQAEANRIRCQAARRLIANAQEQYRHQSATHTYAHDPNQLASILPHLPTCPDGGRYRIRLSSELDRDATGQQVSKGRIVILCTRPGHRLVVGPPPTP